MQYTAREIKDYIFSVFTRTKKDDLKPETVS